VVRLGAGGWQEAVGTAGEGGSSGQGAGGRGWEQVVGRRRSGLQGRGARLGRGLVVGDRRGGGRR
jgi:hypothetical protein